MASWGLMGLVGARWVAGWSWLTELLDGWGWVAGLLDGWVGVWGRPDGLMGLAGAGRVAGLSWLAACGWVPGAGLDELLDGWMAG